MSIDALCLTPSAICAITGGLLLKNTKRSIRGITTDTRTLKPGNLFIALLGETFDGHAFLREAASAGASCLLCENLPELSSVFQNEDVSLVTVPDTLKAFGDIARWYKNTIAPTVIAVTGSVGKTTTKEFIAAVASAALPTLKTEGNLNNEVGLPITLLRLSEQHRAAVVELGMNHAGEIRRLSSIAEPDIAVITNVGTSHIENLGSREGIRDAKYEITEGMHSGSTLILNGDEPLLLEKRSLAESQGIRVLTFGLHENADCRIQDIRTIETGMRFSLALPTQNIRITDIDIPTEGVHNVYNAAAAYLCGQILRMNDTQIRKGLASFENTGMRQKIYESGSCRIIEDCYNASPEAMRAALTVLTDISVRNGGRAIAVLGDMRELGIHSAALHYEIGAFAAERGVHTLLTFGKAAAEIARGAAEHGMDRSRLFTNENLSAPEFTAGQLKSIVLSNDTILFKASRAVQLERVIRIFLKDES